jgi:hypothetical protein
MKSATGKGLDGARDRNRTDTTLSSLGILSPVRLPVSPPGLRSATTEVYRTCCVLVFLSISNPIMLVSLLVSLGPAGIHRFCDKPFSRGELVGWRQMGIPTGHGNRFVPYEFLGRFEGQLPP